MEALAMLERLGHFLVRRRKAVLVGTVVFILASGAFGGKVADHLKAGGFDSPDVESQRAVELLRDEFRQAPPNFLLLVEAKQGTVNDPSVRAEGLRLAQQLGKEEGIGQVISHWQFGPASPLLSNDETEAIVLAEIEGNDQQLNDRAKDLTPLYTMDTDLVKVRVGGFGAIFAEVSEKIESDLAKSESVAVPITLVLLIVVFGSLVAASLPLAIGIISVLGTFLVLRLIASVTDVSIFALSMVTAMGLGLAIDYSLFIVSRFREELRKGFDTEAAVVNTVRTAGRTIIFSGITVAVSLAALLVFPLYFFKSFGYAGIGVVFTAVVGAVIFLPSVLATLGPNVDKVALWKRHPKEVGEGFWHRLAVLVMKRPVPIATGVVIVLLLLGVPFLHVNLGLPDERVLPPGAATREVHDALRADFPSEEVNSIRVVATDVGNPFEVREKIAVYAASLSKLDGVDHVDSFAGEYTKGVRSASPTPISARFATADSVWYSVVPAIDPFSSDAETLVKRIRDGNSPFEDTIIGGASAQLVDAKDSLFGALPWAIAIICVATFILLFMMFGSLLVPLKALVLNFLSLTATFGAMVWVFQDGHLSDALNFTATGSLDISSPILMFCIAFGLSMDYEVFLLSRIKEEYDISGDNEHSVALGLERTGRIVTAAAVLISVVFVAIGFSQVRFIKLFGLGMALAVLMDAFVIRGTLVPAFMRLAGKANWWLPVWLKPLHSRIAVSEHVVLEAAPPARTDPTHPPTAPRRPKPAPRPIESRTTAKRKPAAPKRRQAAPARKKPVTKRKPAKKKPVTRKR
jgi:RND superfamily putative drug exporter